jgi:hypothetical protein
MLRWTISIVFAVALTAPIAIAADTELLSIVGINLPENGYVNEFNIETWGVEVLAVCRLPEGWTITAGKSADPSGILKGEASLGVTFLNQHRIGELRGLFLVHLESYQAEERVEPNVVYPATFKGTISVGTYGGGDIGGREIRIAPTNLLRTPAARCP